MASLRFKIYVGLLIFIDKDKCQYRPMNNSTRLANNYGQKHFLFTLTIIMVIIIVSVYKSLGHFYI